jgi:HPr kinase/phosphorylase
VSQGDLVVRPVRALAGLIEIRGLGVRRCDFVGEAIVGLVVDLAAADAERLPPPQALIININGIKIPRIPVGANYSALPMVLAALTMTESSAFNDLEADCPKGIGNHMRATIATE